MIRSRERNNRPLRASELRVVRAVKRRVARLTDKLYIDVDARLVKLEAVAHPPIDLEPAIREILANIESEKEKANETKT